MTARTVVTYLVLTKPLFLTMIAPIVGTNASLYFVNKDDVISSLFPELFGFVCDLKAELEACIDKIHSLMYIHTCPVLMSSLPFTGYLKNTNENFQKIHSSCNSSHNFTPKRNELRYHCCLSQLYFIRN
jgi:hypothetical protein